MSKKRSDTAYDALLKIQSSTSPSYEGVGLEVGGFVGRNEGEEVGNDEGKGTGAFVGFCVVGFIVGDPATVFTAGASVVGKGVGVLLGMGVYTCCPTVKTCST